MKTSRNIFVLIISLILIFALSMQGLASDDIQSEQNDPDIVSVSNETEQEAAEPETEEEPEVPDDPGDDAEEPDVTAETASETEISSDEKTDKTTAKADDGTMKLFDLVTGSFESIEGYEIATIRYYCNAEKSGYYYADFSIDESTGKYTYSFDAPYNGFAAVQGTEMKGSAPASDATIIAYYYSLSRWDGAVDVSWYNESDADFYIYNPAQLAGVAAIVNGNIDGRTEPYEVRGKRSDLTGASNKALPDSIVSDHYDNTALAAQAEGPADKGRMEHDFANRTIHLMSDLDMGGTDGSNVLMGSGYDIAVDDPSLNWNRNLHKDEYPNWTPIGGEYLMDVEDYDTMNIAFFNGFLDGNGHSVYNLYCYRWSYRKEGYTAFGYSQGVGLIGAMACLYSDDRGDEPQPELMPGVKDLSLSGFVYGRRMVGGVVGVVGGGQSSVEGGVVSSGVTFENIANHAYVYCTDSKGLGGIIGTSHLTGNIINCYNTGRIEANYAAPTGGIIGSNESMNIFCCYSIGTEYSNGNNRGRGIGADNAGSNYTVDNCFYLYGTVEDTRFPGYYDDEAGKNVYVNVNPVSSSQVTDGTLLTGLNQNGNAYVEGDSGYPVLYWEKYSGTGSFMINDSIGGSMSASTSRYSVSSGDSFANGTIIYFTNEAETGYKFRYYTLNGKKMSGEYVTINGDSTVSVVYESSKAGVLKIAENDVCDISVIKSGIIIENGEKIQVTDHPVASGDEIFEGDLLTVTASVKEGKVPDDPDLLYSYFAGMENCFDYGYTYTGSDEEVIALVTYTVTEKINEDDVSLVLDVKPRTTQKLWRYLADTSWYDESKQEFTLTAADQLAGLAVLVDGGNSFSGKTIRLGSDVSFTNTDGTRGKRFWDGMGSTSVGFAGVFDGQGYKITDFHSNQNALFSFITGTSVSACAEVKNLDIYGTADGDNACGIAYMVKNAKITDCNSYMTITGSSGYIGGIAGYVNSGSQISNCVSYGKIDCHTTGSVYIGGIAGRLYNNNKMSSCLNLGDISVLSDNNNYIGGITGQTYSPITECANYGNVYGRSRYVGGLCGQAIAKTAQIRDCYNAGNVTLGNGSNILDSVGGLVGFGSIYVIENSFNIGSVTLNDRETSNIGGLVGKENKNSNSRTDNAYMLNTSCEYVDNSVVYEDLTTASYHAGMKMASAADFASANGVLKAINADGCFILKNSKYPELEKVSEIHVHTGGIATCSEKAICDECGLAYGDLDGNNHKETYTINASDPAWIHDGYTGDLKCLYCGKIVSYGTSIHADTSVTAITINIIKNDITLKTRSYTRAEFDQLKETEPIAYGYGTSDESEIMAASEYVTLDSIYKQFGYTIDDVLKVVVRCAGTTDSVDHDTLTEKCEYHENGTVYQAPAAISMKYTTGFGSLESVASKSEASNSLRFGYGISAKQYEDGVNVGGRRCVSPVIGLDIHVSADSIDPVDDPLNGWIKTADGIWRYYVDDMALTGWQKIDGTWYFMDKSGNMLTGWVKDGQTWYYMWDSGAMAVGWVKAGNTWYYMHSSGAMLTGWQKINSSWYLLKPSGAMAANEWWDGYWLSANGTWTYQPRGSWKKNSTGWWYGDTSGWYAKNTTVKIDDVNYKFNSAGYWIS